MWKIRSKFAAGALAAAVLMTGCGAGAQNTDGGNTAGAAESSETASSASSAAQTAAAQEAEENGTEADVSTGGASEESTAAYGEAAGDGQTAADAVSGGSADPDFNGYLTREKVTASIYDDGNSEVMENTYDQLTPFDYTDPDTGKSVGWNDNLQAALDEINGDVKKGSTDFASQNEDDAKQVKKDMGADYAVYANDDSLQVARADSRVFSVIRETYQNTGGAHGFSATTAYSYNAETGAKLTLADVLKDTDIADLAPVIKKEAVAQAADGQAAGIFTDTLDETVQNMLKATDGTTGEVTAKDENGTQYGPITWYAGWDGVHFVFNAYDIGSYAAGKYFVTLTPEEYPDLVNADLFETPDSYVEPIAGFTQYTVDGQSLYIAEDYESEPEGAVTPLTINGLEVTLGGNTQKFDIYSYGNDYYLFHTPDGTFLYVNTTQDNDLETLECIPLGGNSAADGNLTMTSQDAGFYDVIPLDPSNFLTGTRTTVMSVATVRRADRIGSDGMPEALGKYYLYDAGANLTFTLKQDAELTVLDSLTSEKTVTKTFPKGTTMTPLRTDNEGICDCVTSDGQYIRFAVDTSAMPEMIDENMSIDDLLDGTIFAG